MESGVEGGVPSPPVHGRNFYKPKFSENLISQIDSFDLNGAENVYERSYNGGIKRQIVMMRKAEEQARLKNLEELKKATFTPKILPTPKSVMLPPLKQRIEMNIQRHEQLVERNKELAREREEKELNDPSRSVSHMDGKSKNIVENMSYKSPEKTLAEDILVKSMWWSMQPDDALWLAESKMHAREKDEGTKNKRSFSAGSRTSESAGNRLYNLAVAQRELKDSENSLKRTFESKYLKTGHPASRSVVDRSSSNPSIYIHDKDSQTASNAIKTTKFDLLHAEGETILKKRAQLNNKRTFPFKPTFYTELSGVKPKYLYPVFSHDVNKVCAEKDGKNEKSNNTKVKKESEVLKHIAKIYENFEKSLEKKDKIREEVNKEKYSDCIFTPDLSKTYPKEVDINSETSIAAASVAAAAAEAAMKKRKTANGKNVSVFDSLYINGLERRSKIEEIHKNAELKREVSEVQDCTFRPKISEFPSYISSIRSKSIDFSFSGTSSGMDGKSFSIEDLGSFNSVNKGKSTMNNGKKFRTRYEKNLGTSMRTSFRNVENTNNQKSFSNNDLESLLDVPTTSKTKKEQNSYAAIHAKQMKFSNKIIDSMDGSFNRSFNNNNYNINDSMQSQISNSRNNNSSFNIQKTTDYPDQYQRRSTRQNGDHMFALGQSKGSFANSIDIPEKYINSPSGIGNQLDIRSSLRNDMDRKDVLHSSIDLLDALISAPTPDIRSLLQNNRSRDDHDEHYNDTLSRELSLGSVAPVDNTVMVSSFNNNAYSAGTPMIQNIEKFSKDGHYNDYVSSILSQVEAGTVI